jgi:hypothetical protein
MGGKQAFQRSRPGSRLPVRSKAAGLVIIALAAGVAVLGTVPTAADQSGGRGATARAARTIWVNESVHASNVSHQGNKVINDRGNGKGTFKCVTLVQVRVYYTSGFTSITCDTSEGAIEAAGKVEFFSAGATATFTGTIPITHGTGKYVHGSGHYRVEGTEVRKTYAVEATTSGWFSY